MFENVGYAWKVCTNKTCSTLYRYDPPDTCVRCSSPTQAMPEFDPANINDPRHGSMIGYRHGCRCVACYEAQQVYRRERKAHVHSRDTISA